MSNNNFLIMLLSSILGSLVTTFSYAASAGGKFAPSFLRLPMVAPMAVIWGIIFGVLLSPLMYFCLRDKNLIIVLPIVYFLAFIVAVLLCYIGHRVAFCGAFVFWISILIIMKYFGPLSLR